jgi:squalene synthase HpnC
MPCASFAAELTAFGPDRAAASPPSPAAARAYCRNLARSHYENFTVASWLLPRDLRPHFYHVYAYCRWADDLADETGDRQQSLQLLDWWEDELQACYQGRAWHPVFQALTETIREFSIPIEPLADLLVAFRQDQSVARYETFDELLHYCRYSANPVGRLVLYLGRAHNDECGKLADQVCTGLQLANFWQDVARDFDRGRVYLPQETCRRFNYEPAMFERREYNSAFHQVLKFEVDRAETFLRSGLPLVERVPSILAADVWLFIQGGLKILSHIRQLDYNVWACRPQVSKLDQLSLLVGYMSRRLGLVRSATP